MNRIIAKRLAAHGFVLKHTGGNCFCWERNDGQIVETISDGDFGAPDTITQPVIIHTAELVNGPNEQPGDAEITDGYTLGDVLAALNNPSTEYVLLSGRLYNNLHKTGA